MHAADVMTPDVICGAPETPVAELIRLMLDNRISALPIVEEAASSASSARATCCAGRRPAPSRVRRAGSNW